MFALDRQAGRLAGRWLPAGAAQLVWERIVRDDPDLDPLLSPAGVARAAYQSWRRLHDYNIPYTALDDAESPETAAFARWCASYARWLDARTCMDAALAQQRVHPSAAAPGLEIVGFDRLTPLQQATLLRWEDAGITVHRVVASGKAASVGWVGCLDRAAEIDAAARWAAGRLHQAQDLRIAIVVPELSHRREQVRRTVERVLAPATGLTAGPPPESMAFELAAARPLAEQPIVAAAFDLLDTFVRVPDLAALSRLLRNPFIAEADVEAAGRARLDARIRRFAPAGLGLAGLARLAAERGCPGLTRIVMAGRDCIEKWPDEDRPSNCSSYIFNFLAVLGWPGLRLDSAAHQAEQRWRSLVSEFGACDEFTGTVTRPEAVSLLRDMAGRVLFEPQELRAPLLLIDPETSAGMCFDAIWICGLEASQWPPPAAPDPFLPRALQLRQGVPRASAELASQQARDTLARLLHSADELILSVPQVEDDAPLLPSPLLDGIPARETPGGWTEPRVALSLWTHRPLLEARTDASLPPVALVDANLGGARLLELQSACPFRAQAELRLGATALDEPALGIDAAERGTLVHEALARLWRELGGQAGLLALDAAATRSAARRAVDAALAEARRDADDVLRHLLALEAEWLEARVLEMVEADRQRPPFAIDAIEQACTARIGSLALELRPDRVDRLADGSLAIIDYKTGASADVKAWLDERPRLPQLPAYVQALGPERVGAVSFARVLSGGAGYVGLARSNELFTGLRVPGEKGGPKGFDSWDHLLAEWRRRLAMLAVEYESGDARLAPDPATACRYCHLGALCRIAESRLAAAAADAGDE